MNQEKTFNGTVKDNHLNLLVSFNCREDLVHLRKHFGAEDVERWVVKGDCPILGRALGQTYLTRLCCCVILILHVCFLLSIWFHVWFCVGVVLSGSFRHAVLMRWSYIRKL